MKRFSETLVDVMDLADSYSVETNDAMRLRRDALRELAATAAAWVDGLSPVPLLATGGGHQGSVSPLPWMRIYSPQASPKATAGFYLVYLFDISGDAVFLTLHQGTSRFDGHQWRPLSDIEALMDSSAGARDRLE